ncbi:MAG: SRPBCC family protein [Limnohabitans sp.]|nr:SRPBCC family protein [Limnohabitans sp.]
MATKITISALVNAPLDRVWDNWTKPEHITQWNFAIDTWQCPSASNDLQVGGKYIARMEAKDGSFGFDFEAIYDTVIDKQELTYTMTDGRKATTIFVDNGNATSVTTTFDAESENPVEMQQQGWQAILDNFKKYTEIK